MSAMFAQFVLSLLMTSLLRVFSLHRISVRSDINSHQPRLESVKLVLIAEKIGATRYIARNDSNLLRVVHRGKTSLNRPSTRRTTRPRAT
ncbi:hypothetical protein BJX66DRAFT_88083 [Aspergillus keveii]|uniref:Secreted protein n=1 Tax=Aspergillus keveii TaxID=714993 RepID=A0ABR4GF46_9EURO